jgi:hypothetical protein
MVDVIGPHHGASDEDHPDQIDDQPMDVRCLGHQVHIYSPGRAWIARGRKAALIATFVISATRFFSRGPKTTIVCIPLDADGKLTSAASGFTPDK